MNATIVHIRPDGRAHIDNLSALECLTRELSLGCQRQPRSHNISELLTRRSQLQCQKAELEVKHPGHPQIADLNRELSLVQCLIDNLRHLRS